MMTSMSVDECVFKGGHRYDMGYKLPVRTPMPARIPTDAEARVAQPVKYWHVQNCERCGTRMETAHGFTPRPADQPEGHL